MLNYRKLVYFIILASSLLFSQSLKNGYGLGSNILVNDASSMGVSSTGLVPSYNSAVSLKNPSTWSNLRFTYFTCTYNGVRRNILEDLTNESSNLGNIQFIVPFKSKYSIGLGVHPYLNQFIELDGNTDSQFIAFGDTMDTHHSYSRYGGAAAFNLSFGGNFTKYVNSGISIDFLFGSTREQTVFTISERDYYSQKRHIYSGSLAKLFLNSDVLESLNIPFNVYMSAGFPLYPISIETSTYKPFEDINNSGAQDESDFPKLSNTGGPETEQIDNVSSPIEFQIGFDYAINNTFSLLGEYSNWQDTEKNTVNFSIFNDQFKSVNRYNIGLIKYSEDLSKNLLDMLKIRAGFYSNTTNLLNAKNSIKEYGVSTGLGFNFGITKNSLDFAYSYGKRQGLTENGDESIHRISIGITVGDIWFVKRRAQ